MESKLTTELQQLKEKVATLNQNLANIKNIDKIKYDAEQSKIKNTKEISILKKKSEFLSEQIKALKSTYENKKAQLEANDTYSQLSVLEEKLKQHEAVTFSLRDCKIIFIF